MYDSEQHTLITTVRKDISEQVVRALEIQFNNHTFLIDTEPEAIGATIYTPTKQYSYGGYSILVSPIVRRKMKLFTKGILTGIAIGIELQAGKDSQNVKQQA